MKIDLHCHTIKAKQGDGGRDISPTDLANALADSQVGIAAITNHNLFDLNKYKQCVSVALDKGIDIWPGIELDVRGDSGATGHVIVIADPACADSFSVVCDGLINGVSPDDFVLEWGKLAPAFVGEGFDFIVISHYRPYKGKAYKDKALPYNDNQKLKKSFPLNTPVFFEPSNLKRAGIMYADGVDCLIGSDVKDWNSYSECSLPEIKLKVDSFNQFLLLLRKTPEVLQTIMNKKSSERLDIQLFNSPMPLAFPIFNDVNIVFGAKGTGKTALLKEIESYYRAKDWAGVSSYYASDNNEKYKQMTTVKPCEEDFTKLGIDDMAAEFEILRNWQEPSVTTLESYAVWEEYRSTKADTEHFGFSLASTSATPDSNAAKSAIKDYTDLLSHARALLSSSLLKSSLNTKEFDALRSLVRNAVSISQGSVRETFVSTHALRLQSFTINKMKGYITARTGNPTKPAGTGFAEFVSGYKKVRSALGDISSAFSARPHDEKVMLGRLAEKGDVVQYRKYLINPTHGTGVVYLRDKVRANDLKSMVRAIAEASSFDKVPYAQLSTKVVEINESAEKMSVTSLRDCLGVASSVTCGKDTNYVPSSGERAMIVLSHALFDDTANVYILDEPEASMGNEFINEVIVERINKLSRLNKTVVVSTHNANIAVRTLPWQSIYREYDTGDYRTYIGNPFCDELQDLAGKEEAKSWTQVSMSMLEGGEDAFTERELVYGKLN